MLVTMSQKMNKNKVHLFEKEMNFGNKGLDSASVANPWKIMGFQSLHNRTISMKSSRLACKQSIPKAIVHVIEDAFLATTKIGMPMNHANSRYQMSRSPSKC